LRQSSRSTGDPYLYDELFSHKKTLFSSPNLSLIELKKGTATENKKEQNPCGTIYN
jgi:hypothetical protein